MTWFNHPGASALELGSEQQLVIPIGHEGLFEWHIWRYKTLVREEKPIEMVKVLLSF